ncbi:hypothetical protein CHS0354_041684 [Potamilus streckersoni]|uniref:N-acetyltransferase domain-containing protein n=1 Tax=Potamilus streckersoni TaxID=2493646 RepID=A0AAE0SCV0_9BIVA|nr:hypothetical protein CHS0354_041684 [Potamilus streckersoni]
MTCVIKEKKTLIHLPYLPMDGNLKDGTSVVLDRYCNEYEADFHDIIKFIVNEGDRYPHEDMNDVKDFRSYYLSHDIFICTNKATRELLGAFYVKPKFAGRCSHICTGGFAVKGSARKNGVGSFLAQNYLYIARDLAYKASYFNLVFVSNKSSVGLWRKLGFKEIGRIPKAGNLKGLGYTDALQFYYDLETLPKTQS